MPSAKSPRLFFCILCAFFGLSASPAFARLAIDFEVPASLGTEDPVRLTLEDVGALLSAAFPGARIGHDLSTADVRIALSLGGPSAQRRAPGTSPLLQTASQGYVWTSRRLGNTVLLELAAASPAGISSGLYGLLQEKLGFCFIHPRQSVVPQHQQWPLADRWQWRATPRFPRRGFHLHTLHPIELTRQLHEPTYPGALQDLRGYIDWLARNGQNVFQFYLLRGIDRDRWPDHAQAMIAYAHRRGVRVGVMLSFSMLQQRAFQAVKLLRPFAGYRSQIDNTLDWLFQAPWDFVTVEFMLGEHLPRLDRLLPEASAYLQESLRRRGAFPIVSTHVDRREEDERGGGGLLATAQAAAPVRSGILIHTVMSYGLDDEEAPVYGNRNLQFMAESARREVRRRETWYWPESSYWVAFDNSVPVLLLPYLEARWKDIQLVAKMGLQGHLTFSSGWEWGYWLTDWSIAKWSWRHEEDSRRLESGPLSALEQLIPDPELRGLWRRAAALQQYHLKDGRLLQYLSAADPFSEFPRALIPEFQPQAEASCGWILDEAERNQAGETVEVVITRLEDYARRSFLLTSSMVARLAEIKRSGQPTWLPMAQELWRALKITELRACYRAAVIQALLQRRVNAEESLVQWLAEADRLRRQAQILVAMQEKIYRYPVALLARPRPSLTAYRFGYLYPVSDLFFWRREERQVMSGRCDPFFMKLWDFSRTLGLESLFF